MRFILNENLIHFDDAIFVRAQSEAFFLILSQTLVHYRAHSVQLISARRLESITGSCQQHPCVGLQIFMSRRSAQHSSHKFSATIKLL